jgi:hypothetical protein
MWQPFKVLKKTFAVSRRAEQLHLRVCSSALSLLLRNRYSVQRWRTLSHRKWMPLTGAFISP